jgi:cytoskeletal protein CcmA (bactofilin family)
MMNLGRRDRPFDTKDLDSSALKASTLGTVGTAHRASDGTLTRTAESSGSALRPPPPAPTPAPTPAGTPDRAAKPLAEFDFASAAIGPDTPGSKLCVGPKIKLKGVEISDCDVLVVEGEVEATVNSKAMQIAQPGTLKGRVSIDVAEIYGDFSGELTARAKLIVHSTGRVAGTIRYGKLIVAEGGELSGDVQRLDANNETTPARKSGAASEPPPLFSPATTR